MYGRSRRSNQEISGVAGQERSVAKGMMAGAIGGAIAAHVMGMFMQAMQKGSGNQEQQATDPQQQEKPTDPTVRVAEAFTRALGIKLKEEHKPAAGQFVHYTFGSKVGGLYGMLAELTPRATIGFGTLYGTAVWAGADEVALPLLKLTPKPNQIPAKVHIGMLAAHLVYGVTLETVRRAVRPLLDRASARGVVDRYRPETWPTKRVEYRRAA